MFVSTFVKKLKKAFGMYANPIEIPKIRKNQFRVLRPLKLRKVVGFGNFARIANLCVGFLLGTLHGYYLHSDYFHFFCTKDLKEIKLERNSKKSSVN